VRLLGVNEESCFILDTSARNEDSIIEAFSKLVFPQWFFLRFIRFDGEVQRLSAAFDPC
jgi:hypothetical protein